MPGGLGGGAFGSTMDAYHVYDAGLTPAKLRKPRAFHRGSHYCPRCAEYSTRSSRGQRCAACQHTLQSVCPYCDRAYARRTIVTHRLRCQERWARAVAASAPIFGLGPPVADPALLQDYRGLDWVVFV